MDFLAPASNIGQNPSHRMASRRRQAPPPTPAPWAREAAQLGATLRARRKALGLTQEDLARFAGCGLAFLYELETGKPTLRLDKLLDVLQVLGLALRLEHGKTPLVVIADAESSP
jgi:HTH-type transcriptional regulator / antitoxin HipB